MVGIQIIAYETAHCFAAGKVNEGNLNLRRLMALQVPASGEHPGNFRFYEHDSHIADLNALSFCAPFLGYVAMEHAGRIDSQLTDRFWKTTLPLCLPAFDEHYQVKSGVQADAPSPRWWQGNIWALNIAGRLIIARALGDHAHVERARAQLSAYRKFVNTYGIGEYNSPIYLVVQAEGFHWAWRYAPDAVFREDARAMLDVLYLDLAEHYHAAAGVLAGTWSRHYPVSYEGVCRYGELIESAFKGHQPTLLESLGLEDYSVPSAFKKIAFTRRSYSVWRRSVQDVRRMHYQTDEYSLATQSGDYVWKQQDTPVLATWVGGQGKRRVALIRSPYWANDPTEAMDYARPFKRWAHQFENRSILAYSHQAGGNDLLFNLATMKDYAPELWDGIGQKVTAAECPILPAAPLGSVDPEDRKHFRKISSDLTYLDPRARATPGVAVCGTVIVAFPSCFMIFVPAKGLILHVAIMRGELQLIIPVRPRALLAMVMLGRSQCPNEEAAIKASRQLSLAQGPLPNFPNGVWFRGLGPELSAAYGVDGGLSDCRVESNHLALCADTCHSPFFRWRPGEPMDCRSADCCSSKMLDTDF
jgi:hypothetical protein